MAFEPPVVVYDACVLYLFHTRNLLTQCAVDRLVEARWTDAIHAEWIRNLVLGSILTSARLVQPRLETIACVASPSTPGFRGSRRLGAESKG
jgi:hypothetical protein